MISSKVRGFFAGKLAWLLLLVALGCLEVAAQPDKRFGLLQTETATYKNVTVICQTKTDVFIKYDGGMTNIKIRNLPPEIQVALGYSSATSPGGFNRPALAKADSSKHPAATNAVLTVAQSWRRSVTAMMPKLKISWPLTLPGAGVLLTRRLLALLIAGILAWHVFFSYCCLLICMKTRVPAGPLIWIPVLQIIPLARAAGMSRWWFVAVFVPVLNVIGFIIWSVRIARVRGKNALVSLLLLLPVTSAPAFVYLAFSSAPAERTLVKFKSMALKTA